MYTRKRDAGLGLPRLAHLVTLAYFQAGAALCGMDDPAVKEITSSHYFQSGMYNTVTHIPCPWP
jgi:hypothetical protein